jgi:hypothetical protein
MIDDRNRAMKASFKRGVSIDQLAIDHCLTMETIKKIVYTK